MAGLKAKMHDLEDKQNNFSESMREMQGAPPASVRRGQIGPGRRIRNGSDLRVPQAT